MIQLIKSLLGLGAEEDNRLGNMWLILGFKDPGLLNEIPYQKEAILVLIVRAMKAQQAGRNRFQNLKVDKLAFQYREERNSYTDDVRALRQIHPIFAELPLHWSQLPEFIRKWQETTSSKLEEPALQTMKMLETD